MVIPAAPPLTIEATGILLVALGGAMNPSQVSAVYGAAVVLNLVF